MPYRKSWLTAGPSPGQLTFAEQARRAQLVEATVRLIAEHGYPGCSLQRIADAAGITKAAVIYHFATKRAVIRAAHDTVTAALGEHVGAAIEQATTPALRVDAFIRGTIGYLGAHPDHVRVVVEAPDDVHDSGSAGRPGPPERWRQLARLLDAAGHRDARLLAIMLSGSVDAVVAEFLRDRSFDLATAADAVVGLLHHSG